MVMSIAEVVRAAIGFYGHRDSLRWGFWNIIANLIDNSHYEASAFVGKEKCIDQLL